MQGGAADLVSAAMIKTFRMLQSYGTNARMLLQIHDSLAFEVKASLLLELVPKIKYSMENAVQMKCKTPVVPEVGKTLGDMHEARIIGNRVEIVVEIKENKEKVWGDYIIDKGE